MSAAWRAHPAGSRWPRYPEQILNGGDDLDLIYVNPSKTGHEIDSLGGLSGRNHFAF
jgi:hypothetical protein